MDAEKRPNEEPAAPGSPAPDAMDEANDSPRSTAPVSKTAHINFELLSKYFHLPMKEVALELGVCTTMLKRLCRNHGIPRWPFRQIKSIDRMIKTMDKSKEVRMDSSRILQALQQKRKNLLTQPQQTVATAPPENLRVKKITQYTFVPNSDSRAPMEIVSEVHNVPSPPEEMAVPAPPAASDSPSPFHFAPSPTSSFSFTARSFGPTHQPPANSRSAAPQHFPSADKFTGESVPELSIRRYLDQIQSFAQECDQLYQQCKQDGGLQQQSEQELLARQQRQQQVHRVYASLQTLREQLAMRQAQAPSSFGASDQALVTQQLQQLRAQLYAPYAPPPLHMQAQYQQSPPLSQQHQQLPQQHPQHQHQQQQARMFPSQTNVSQFAHVQQAPHPQMLLQQQKQLHLQQQQQQDEQHQMLMRRQQLQLQQQRQLRAHHASDAMEEDPAPVPARSRKSWSLDQSMEQVKTQHQLYIELQGQAQGHRSAAARTASSPHEKLKSRSPSTSPPAMPLSPGMPLSMPMTTSSSVRKFSQAHTPQRRASTTPLSSSSGALPRASVRVSPEPVVGQPGSVAARRVNTHGVLTTPPVRTPLDHLGLASSQFLSASRVAPSAYDCSAPFQPMRSSSMRDFSRTDAPQLPPGSFPAHNPQREMYKLPELKISDETRGRYHGNKIATLEPAYRPSSPGP